MNTSGIRTRWAALGAAVAVTFGAGSLGLVSATSPSDAVTYVPIDPCRVADTRSAPEANTGPRATPISQDETHAIAAHGSNGDCTGIPTTATAVQLNVTALGATSTTFLTFWGSGSRPNVSSLNPVPGQPPTPNAVTAPLSTTGVFNVYNAFGSVDIVVDIVGYYTDHQHDERYYTKAEVDAALVRNPVSVETSTAQYEYIVSNPGSWQPVISTTITIPNGYTAVVAAEFGAETSCYGSASGFCSIRILADSAEMEPAEGTENAFDSTDGGIRTVVDWDETSITRAMTLPAGEYTISVEAFIPPGNIGLRLDDLILFVEGHLIPA